MKFDCGPTWEEKLRADKEWRSNWHNWFALIPRRVGPNECRWLEIIERKGESYEGYAHAGYGGPVRVTKWRYEYRVKQ